LLNIINRNLLDEPRTKESVTRLTQNSLINNLTQKLETKPCTHAGAAVAILVRPINKDLEFFLVKRAEVDDDPWSGDMAFPGGKKNKEDNTLIDTVVREVLEETNIKLSEKQIIGFMEPVYSSVRTDLAVQPIVYRFNEYPKVHLNYELTKYFWVPLSQIKKAKTQAVIKGWEGPVYKIQEETVWGLTFQMLEKIFTLLEI
jgi:8-oxo-dGTP pyrophosphatase MutT (NUDIX family)